MKRFSVNDIVLKVLGLLRLTAAVLKGHEPLTVPVLLAILQMRKSGFAATPIVVLMAAGKVRAAWEGQAPDPQTILAEHSSVIEEVEAIRIVRQQHRQHKCLVGKGGDEYEDRLNR